jgi:hypothetical protein
MSHADRRALEDAVERLLGAPAPPGAQALTQALRGRHGDTVAAVLFYGSNFRRGDDSEGLLDLYVLVDDARAALGNRLSAFACRWLPPNVYYLELPLGERTVRCKYALLETGAFARHMTARQSYFWGRFGQASGLLYARDAAVRGKVSRAIAQAVVTLLGRSLPLLGHEFDEAAWWRTALAACYTTELRPERPGAVDGLVRDLSPWRGALTPLAARCLPGVTGNADSYRQSLARRTRFTGRLRWAGRGLLGKGLNVARLIKASFTFAGGIDYLLWKVERHSGVRIEPTPFLRRHPLLGIWGVAWRLWRRGGFR